MSVESHEFPALAEAEEFLTAQGFKPTGIADWINSAGDDAGVYSIEGGRYGAVKGFRVEIRRRGETPTGDSPKPSEGLSRRLMLAGLAAVGIPMAPQTAAAEPDPIFRVIERHRELAAHYSAAVDISGNMTGNDPGFEAAELVTQERCDALLDYSDDELISLLPTTLAGVIALARYMAGIPEWQRPRGHVTWEIDGAPADWHQILLHTLADGVDALTGKAVRS